MPNPPKALLFDIGGVCVVSPFQAILDYERSLSVPPGWVNISISSSKPNGSWHKLERGQMKLDAEFFKAFNADLRREDLWRQHVQRARKQQKEKPQNKQRGKKEPWEGDENDPIPPLPDLDGEKLIWKIIQISRTPDPNMLPALHALQDSGRFLIAALSNTMPFPDGHPWNENPYGELKVYEIFDPYVSSAVVGIRKPEREAYELALKLMRERWEREGKEGKLEPGDVLFVDDIGENLKMGSDVGFRTLKVSLGKTADTVKELEEVTGLKLAGGKEAGSKL